MNAEQQTKLDQQETTSILKDEHEWIGIDTNLWMYSILEYLNPLDLFFGISKCCKVSKRLVEEFICKKINSLKIENTNCEESEIIWFAIKSLKSKDDDEFDLHDDVEMEGMMYLDLAEHDEGFYEFCLQQHIVNVLKRFDKEWISEGLLNLVSFSNNNATQQHVTNCQPHHDATIFENVMNLIGFYRSNLKESKNHVVVENGMEINDRIRKQSLSQENYDKYPNSNVVKCSVLGCGGVGKTTLCKSFQILDFDPCNKYIATIGCCVSVHNMTTPLKNEGLIVALWDTAGGERFALPRDAFVAGAKYAIIAFDLTSRYTLSQVLYYIRNALRVSPSCKIILVGTKSDVTSQRKVNYYSIYKRSTSYRVPYIEISSKLSKHNTIPMWFFYVMEHLFDQSRK